MLRLNRLLLLWGSAFVVGITMPVYANTDGKSPSTTAKSPAAPSVAHARVQKCAEIKRRIAAYQAAPKGQKNPSDESIKSDIVWYQQNCP